MKALLAAAAAAAIVSTAGCVIVPAGHHRAAVSDEKCPPGHRWSDGRCHEKGKGHDPAKHER